MATPQTEFALHFEAEGSGLPLLLIHGFPLGSRMWAGQLESLSNRAHVLAPDLPGFGDSPISGLSYTVERYAEDCAAVLDALDVLEPVALGGLSMGGYIALAFARLFPERVGALLLLSPPARPPPVPRAGGRPLAALPPRRGRLRRGQGQPGQGHRRSERAWRQRCHRGHFSQAPGVGYLHPQSWHRHASRRTNAGCQPGRHYRR